MKPRFNFLQLASFGIASSALGEGTIDFVLFIVICAIIGGVGAILNTRA